MSEVWELIRAERHALLDELTGLTGQEWTTPSLCVGWTVQEVSAHLAWASALRPREVLGELARSGLRPNRLTAESAVRWSSRGVPAILAQLRRNAEQDAKPMGVPPSAALVDAVIHALDIRRPLGRSRTLPDQAFRRTADFCADARWPASMLLGGSARRRLAGLRLVAEDRDWATGEGAEVRASGEAVLLVLSGRPVRPDELRGPGAAELTGRLR